MTVSAFGVVHGTAVSKADKPSRGNPSAGRTVTGLLFPAPHGFIAGRKGHKWRSALTETGTRAGGTVGGGIVGGAVGAGLGRIAHRTSEGAALGAGLGGTGGGIGWQAHQINRNNKLGRYKRQS